MAPENADPDSRVMTAERQQDSGEFRGKNSYRWIRWLAGIEIGLLILAVVLDVVLGAHVTAGLLAATTVLIACTGVLISTGVAGYRLLSGRS